MEVAMTRHSVALAALSAAHLIFPISGVFAQTAPNTVVTGDAWPSREELIYIPREALELPNPSELDEIEIVTGDDWPSRRKQNDIRKQTLTPNLVEGQALGRTHR
jgi:hypothetical protein